MEELLLSLGQALGTSRFMSTSWGWPFIESLHFIGLSLLVGTVGLFDLRLLGFVQAIPLRGLHKFIPLGVLGFVMNALTGLMFVTSNPDQYIYNPSFQLKLLCMLCAGLNLVLFYSTTFRKVLALEPSPAVLRTAKVFATISLLCWIGVITGGRLITFYRPPYHWCFWCG
jgi:hypothetical protein